MKQTLDHTALGTRRAGDLVNLERAARVDSRLGGHIEQFVPPNVVAALCNKLQKA